MAMCGNRIGGVGGGVRTHFLRPPSHNGILFQVPGAVPVGTIQRLARGDLELAERAS